MNSTAGEVKWFNITQNEQNKGGVEMKNSSAQLVFTSVNKAHTGTYACGMGNMRNMSGSKCSQLENCGKRCKPTNTHRSRKKGLRKGEERGKRRRTLLRRCEVTSAQRFRTNSELLQSEH